MSRDRPTGTGLVEASGLRPNLSRHLAWAHQLQLMRHQAIVCGEREMRGQQARIFQGHARDTKVAAKQGQQPCVYGVIHNPD